MRRRGRQHLAHAGAAARPFIADDDDVALLVVVHSTASKASSSQSKQRAGPLKTWFCMPATFTIAPCGARLPLRTTTPPVGDSGLAVGADHVLIGREFDVLQILGDGLAGDGHAVAVEIAAVEQRLHQHRHAADLVQVLGHIAAARLEIGDIGRRAEDLADVVQIEIDARLMRHRRQMQRRHWSSRRSPRPPSPHSRTPCG